MHDISTLKIKITLHFFPKKKIFTPKIWITKHFFLFVGLRKVQVK